MASSVAPGGPDTGRALLAYVCAYPGDALLVRADEVGGWVERDLLGALQMVPDGVRDVTGALYDLGASDRTLALADELLACRPDDNSDAAREIRRRGGGATARRVWTLGELQQRPELTASPEPALPRLAWRQRVTLLAAREKMGKSTLVAHAVAARSRGKWFLGEIAGDAGRCLWVFYEGHPSDVVRNLTAADAAPDDVIVAQGEPGRPDTLRALIVEYRPAVVVVDALSSFAVGLVADSWRAEQWTPVMNQFGAMAHELDTAIVLIHHATKSGTGYADSRAIGAGVDMILEMDGTAGDSEPRKVKGVGRWPYSPFSVRMEGDQLLLGGPSAEPSSLVKTLHAMIAKPGIGSGGLRAAVGGSAKVVDADAARLIRSGLARDEPIYRADGTIEKHQYFAAEGCLEAVSQGVAGQGVGQGGLSARNSLSDIAVTDTRTSPLSLVPDSTIGTRGQGARYPCPGGCGTTFSAQLRNPCEACREKVPA